MGDIATLQLTSVWVNLLPTGEAVAANSAPERPQLREMDGAVDTYAGGRQRAITTDGVKGRWGMTLVNLPLSTVLTVESWLGRTVQVRDHRGQRVFGTFFSVNRIEWKEPLLYSVAIVVQVLTVPEGV